MCGWKQVDMFLAGQESRDCLDFISDVRRYLFVSGSFGSWYCQIKTTGLIMRSLY